MAEIENLDIQISAGASQATASLQNLLSNMRPLDRVIAKMAADTAGMVAKMTGLASSADGAASSVNSTALAIRGISAAVAQSKLSKCASDIAMITRNATNASRALQVMSNALGPVIFSFGGGGGRRGGGGNGGGGFSPWWKERLALPGDNFIDTNFVDKEKISRWKELADAAKEFISQFASGFREGLAGASGFGGNFFKEFAQGFKQGFTDTIKNGHSALEGFLKLAKRIMIIRAIRSAIKFVTDGIGEGIKNLYAWSELADGTFKGSMDSLATSAQYAGNSIAAMASPLINALAPAIDFIIDKFVEMFNVINQILAKLTGKGTYTAAVKTASAWSGAAKKAGGAANDMKKTILAFDEINKLADQNSGGGGGGSSADAGAMFEERAIDSKISEFVANIKLAINMENWQGLGKILGDKINELIDSIPWAEYGAKFGSYINAWFSTKYWTIHFTDFENIGKHIAEFLNNAISKIDWEIIGRSISQWPTKILDLFIGVIKEFDFAQAATAISNVIKGLFDEITDWIERQDWIELGSTLVTKIVDFITNLDVSGIVKALAKLLWAIVKAAVGLAVGMIGGLWDILLEGLGVKGEFNERTIPLKARIVTNTTDIQEQINKQLETNNDPEVPVGVKITTTAETIFDTILKAWDSLDAALQIGLEAGWSVIEGLWDSIKSAWAELKATVPVIAWISNTAEDLWKTITEEWEKLKAEVPLIATISNTVSDVAKWFKGKWDKLSSKLKEVGFIGIIKNTAKDVVNWFKKQWDEISESVRTVGVWATITTKASELWAWIKEQWQKLKTELPILASIANTAADLWEWLSSGWDSEDTIVDVFVNLVKDGWTSISDWVGDLWVKLNVQLPKISVTWDGIIPKFSITWGDTTSTESSQARYTGYRNVPTPAGGEDRYSSSGLRANGGTFSSGRWHGIPQFAGGGIFGSMFLAGEAGPELVGHVGNRTEVLNKSQLASAMFAAVRSAMAPTEIGMREAMSGGSTSDAYGNRGNSDTTLLELLREQNALLQEIAEKEITTSGINYAQRRANRRAGMVIAPVGT